MKILEINSTEETDEKSKKIYNNNIEIHNNKKQVKKVFLDLLNAYQPQGTYQRRAREKLCLIFFIVFLNPLQTYKRILNPKISDINRL